jgi:hypothetical protein
MPANNPTCFEDGSFCNFASSPFDAMMQPISFVLGVFTYPIIYGIFLGIIWIKTKDTMMVGIVGMLMASLAIGNGVFQNWNNQILIMGVMLFSIALGITMYQLYTNRITQSSY